MDTQKFVSWVLRSYKSCHWVAKALLWLRLVPSSDTACGGRSKRHDEVVFKIPQPLEMMMRSIGICTEKDIWYLKIVIASVSAKQLWSSGAIRLKRLRGPDLYSRESQLIYSWRFQCEGVSPPAEQAIRPRRGSRSKQIHVSQGHNSSVPLNPCIHLCFHFPCTPQASWSPTRLWCKDTICTFCSFFGIGVHCICLLHSCTPQDDVWTSIPLVCSCYG